MDPLVCHNVIFFSKLSNNSCKNFVRLLHQERLDRAMLSINDNSINATHHTEAM